MAWSLRKNPNVLLMHFADMKRNLPHEVDRMAKFLGKELTAEERQRVSTHTTFQWMKEHESLFNADMIGFRKPDRKGKVGEHAAVVADAQRACMFERAKGSHRRRR